MVIAAPPPSPPCIECAFVVFTLESGLGQCALDAHQVNPPLEVRIGTEFIVYSSNNDKIMHGYTPLNSNIVKALRLRPPQTLYLPSKIRTTKLRWPIMLGWYLLDAVDKETTYQVVLCSSSKFTFHVVYYQRQCKANNWMDFSVCFDTSRMLTR